MKNEIKLEEEKLDTTLEKISLYLKEELDIFDELQLAYRRNPERFGIAYHTACDNIRRYKSALEKPFFARIDFKEDQKEKQKYYIGKYGIQDLNSNLIVLDWRAPISSLYYDSEIGPAFYECPDGKIKGTLNLKRQFEIENGKMLDYHDVDIVSNDDLLQKYLQENNDMRLKNIVSTIQAEQNAAIRKSAYTNTVIQGVAGSGKTTIALHRIAYLVYNYKNKIKNNQYMVIGPNEVFLKYIESVLPDLDVSGIEQLTFEKLAKEIINEEFEIRPSSKQLTSYLSRKNKCEIEKFKGSEDYIRLLDSFMNKYLESLTINDLKIDEFVLVPHDVIKEIFEIIINDSYTYKQLVDRFVLLVSKYIENHMFDIKNKFNNYVSTIRHYKENDKLESLLYKSDSCNGSLRLTKLQIEKYKDEKKLNQFITQTREEIEKTCKSTIRKYISKYKDSPQKIYELFINDLASDKSFNIPNLIKTTKNNIKESNYDYEDLAALMYIKSKIGLAPYYKNYKHIVIDEAQDYTKANYIALRKCLPNAYFSIYGDIAQSIYDYRSIDSWDEIIDIFENIEVLKFKKSYRTTDQIMSVANAVSESIGLDSSELSVRQGDNVNFNKIEDKKIPEYIVSKLNEYKKKGYKTIAIISKYPTQSSYINDDLSFEGLIIPNIDETKDVTTENCGMFTIPSYLAKGLEFDAVIINNANENIYNSNSLSDMKLLYVAITRALHEVDIIYTDELTKPLQKFVKEKCIQKTI